jgi:hypothetical protein
MKQLGGIKGYRHFHCTFILTGPTYNPQWPLELTRVRVSFERNGRFICFARILP